VAMGGTGQRVAGVGVSTKGPAEVWRLVWAAMRWSESVRRGVHAGAASASGCCRDNGATSDEGSIERQVGRAAIWLRRKRSRDQRRVIYRGGSCTD